MVTPRYLVPGDTVAIVSTARKISASELSPALELLSSWGLKSQLGATIDAASDQFAGDDQIRASDLQKMMDDPKIAAIWCARGGYGTVRVVDMLDFTAFRANPKWIIGYSDITVLHSHIHNFGIESIHAQMPLEIDTKTTETSTSLKNLLLGENYGITVTSEEKLNRNGAATGQLLGGNLSVLYSLCGSTSAIETHGKILFLEDLDEYLYHIDRMMQNLKRNGLLENLAGLVVGGLTKMHDNTIPFGKTAKEILRDAVSRYDYPVLFDFPAGHVNDNRALIFGRRYRLNVSDSQSSLTPIA